MCWDGSLSLIILIFSILLISSPLASHACSSLLSTSFHLCDLLTMPSSGGWLLKIKTRFVDLENDYCDCLYMWNLACQFMFVCCMSANLRLQQLGKVGSFRSGYSLSNEQLWIKTYVVDGITGSNGMCNILFGACYSHAWRSSQERTWHVIATVNGAFTHWDNKTQNCEGRSFTSTSELIVFVRS